jgi:DNA-binding MarR family transcriptional regulator
MAERPAAAAPTLSDSISRFFRLAGKAKFRMQSEHEVEWSTFAILTPLAECGPLRSTALAETTHLDPSRVSRLTNHLIDLGHVERTPDAADGRASLLSITAAGRESLDRLQRKREAFLNEVVADWSILDQETLADLLGRLAADMGRAIGCDPAARAHHHPAASPAHDSSPEEH